MNLHTPKPKPPRVLIFGVPGIGKTTFGTEAPEPIFITTEDGADNFPDLAQFESATSWSEFITNLSEVSIEDHKYKTLVIDTMSGLVELAIKEATATKFDGDLNKWNSYGKGDKMTAELIETALYHLDRCRDKGMLVLMLSHRSIVTIKDAIAGEYDQFTMQAPKNTRAKIVNWCDIVGHAYNKVVITNSEDDKASRAIHQDVRSLDLRHSPSQECKTRAGWDMPENMPFTWADFAGALDQSDPIGTLRGLWPVLDAEKQKDALEKYGVDKIEDLDKSAQRAFIVRLEKIKEKSDVTT
ncbi:MAG: ATP-binding protein [Proteobacteria bacterium]|nr:ATP-binding protein [Pseudomonadota bacterium]